MDSSSVACDLFLSINTSRKCCVIDVVSLLGGVFISWDPICVDLRSFVTVAGLMMEGKIKGFDSSIRILNVYEPYNHR